MSEPTAPAVTHEFPGPESSNVVYNPDFDRLRSFSSHLETTTEYGSPAYVTDERSRNAEKTKNDVDHRFTPTDREHVRRAQEGAAEADLVCLDRRVGRHPDHSYVCRLYVPKAYGRIALAWGKLLEPVEGTPEPDFRTLQLPEYGTTRVRVFVEDGVTYVLGSDYTGEAKKSFLRLFMHRAKAEGGLGIHAGTKRLRLEDGDDGGLREVGQAFLGLSGTGKSTLTCHGCRLSDPESARMLQDDVCALRPDGTVAGSEGGGLYAKTAGLAPDEQPGLHEAVTQPHAVLENVAVGADGTVDFDDGSLTTNGRAVIRREDLPSADDDVDLDAVDQLFFITRNPLMPPVGRLTPEQAAVAFMLGESVETSAGDPDRAGEAVRVVGTNPFIVGSEGEEGNRFYDLVVETGVDVHLLNTGSVGDDRSVTVEETVSILTETARGSVEWEYDDLLRMDLPRSVPGVDVGDLYPPDRVEDYEAELSRLRDDRRAYLDAFDDLRPELRDAVY